MIESHDGKSIEMEIQTPVTINLPQRKASLSATKVGKRGPREGEPQRPHGSALQPINFRRIPTQATLMNGSHTTTTAEGKAAAAKDTVARAATILAAPPKAPRTANPMTQSSPPREAWQKTAVPTEGKASAVKEVMIEAVAIEAALKASSPANLITRANPPKKGKAENIYGNGRNVKIRSNRKDSNKNLSSKETKPPICLILQ